MLHHFGKNRASLDDAGVGSDVALKDGDAAVGHVGILDGTDDGRVCVDAALNVLAHCLSADCHHVEIKQIFLGQFVHYRVDSAGLIEIFHVGGACRCQVAQVRSFVGNHVRDFHIQFHAGFMRDGRKVKHCICRAPESHIHCHGVHESLLGHDISGTDILLNQFHDLHAGVLGETDSRAVDRRDRTVALKAHSDGLGEAVHGVSGVHTGAGTAGRTYLLLILSELLHSHLAGCYGADCLEHGGKASLASVDVTCQHGTAGDKDRGDIDACGRHKKSGDVLVAVGDHDQSVKTMRLCHTLGGVGDKVSCHQ